VLNPEGTFEWDVQQFESTLERASKAPAGSEERAALYHRALELYRGPFAEAFYSEWADTIRRRLEDHSHQALSVLGGYYAGRGDFEAAAECMERLLHLDHFNEEAAFQLARYRAQGGQPASALAAIDQYSRTYEEEMGAPLPRRFHQLRSQIAAGAGF
jgi:DNA-binding SARP family transcriptional activator